MYYRSVNRGAALTPAGRYTVGLILGLGLVAIGSGLNGVFLSFSLAISILVISGHLSEKIMSAYEVTGCDDVMAEPDLPFALSLKVKNKSQGREVYGVENIVLREFPKIGKWNLNVNPLGSVKVVSLLAKEEKEIAGQCSGLPRGHYKNLVLLQRTLYPFGILTKFKFSELNAVISIPPKFDLGFAKEVKEELSRHRLIHDLDREFHHHRPYEKMESQIDWKKSAGRPEAEWVVKVYESKRDDFGVLILPAWEALPFLDNELAYENFLSRIRTVADCFQGMDRLVACASSQGVAKNIIGSSRIRNYLTQVPSFSNKSLPFENDAFSALPRGVYQVCRVGPEGFHWLNRTIEVLE